MNQQKQPSDLDLGRDWLERAAFSVDHVDRAARPDALEFARVAAMIGAGYVALAHAERVRRAAAEARPHDHDSLLDRAADVLTTLSTGWEGEPPDGVAEAEQWLREFRKQHVAGCAVCNPEVDRG